MVDDRRRYHDEDVDPDAISVWDLPLAPPTIERASPPATEIAAAAPRDADGDETEITYVRALASTEEWFEEEARPVDDAVVADLEAAYPDEDATPEPPPAPSAPPASSPPSGAGMLRKQPEESEWTRFSRAPGGAPASREPEPDERAEAPAAPADMGASPPQSYAPAPAETAFPAAVAPGSRRRTSRGRLLFVAVFACVLVALGGLLAITLGAPAGSVSGLAALVWLVSVGVAVVLVGGAAVTVGLLRRSAPTSSPPRPAPPADSRYTALPAPPASFRAPPRPAAAPRTEPEPPSPLPSELLAGAPPIPFVPGEPSATPSPYERFVPPRPTDDDSGAEWAEGDTIVGRYRVARRIVSGMGVVYLCHDAIQRVPVAIKTYRDLDGEARTPDGRQRDVLLARLFEAEALIWTRLGSHPNIVEALYVVELHGKPYLFLELVCGPDGRERTLRQLVKAGPQEPARALRLGLQVCAGLEHATTVFPGLVHRDLKPENLLLADGDIVKVTDFGLTRVFADVSGRVAALAGTPAYMSPEQCLGLTSLDTRADIYSLGVILYELLTGRRPFTRDYLQAHLTETPADPRELIAELPESLARVVLRCLAKRPEERFQTFGELRAALAGCHVELTGRPAELPVVSRKPRTEREQAGVDLARAISLATLGRYDEAVELLNRAVLFDPGYAEAWRWRGIGLTALGQLAEAADCFDRAVALAPEDIDAWLEKGRLASRLGRREEAMQSFDAALRVDPEHVGARYERGAALFFLGRYAEAQPDLEWANLKQPGPALQAAVDAASRRGASLDVAGDMSALDGLPVLISESAVRQPAPEKRP